MSSTEPSQAGSLGDYAALIRRQWVVLVIAVLLGSAIGVGLLAVLPKSYTATSSVLVKAITDPGETTTEAADARTTGTINMDTESQVVKSLPVASAVKDSISSPLTPVELAAHVSVTIPPNTTIISIAYEADTADGAQEGAAAFADAYLKNRASVAQDRVDQQIRKLNREAANTDRHVESLLEKLPTLVSGSPERVSAEQDVRRLRNRSSWIDDQLLPLQTAQTRPGNVIVSAQRPSAPATPNRVLVLGSTLSLMLLFGLVVAWWRDGHQGRIRVAREVESALSVEVLGTVQDSHMVEQGGPTPSALRRTAQEYRQIVHAIQARISDDDPAVLVTGVGQDSVAQEVAHALGTAVARTGTDVTLVYSDDAAVEAFAPEREIGARSGRGRRASLETTSLEAADLLVEGDVQNRALPEYLEKLRAVKDRLVLLSTPPTERSADAQAVAPSVRLTILVVELNRTTHADLDGALRQLHQVGVDEISAIVVERRKLARGWRRPSTSSETSGPPPGGGDGDAEATEERGRSARDARKPQKADLDPSDLRPSVRGST